MNVVVDYELSIKAINIQERRKHMRKLKLVRIVKPELVAYLCHNDERLPDYRCGNPDCGYGVAEEYVACPYCGSELDWKRLDERSAEFKKLMENRKLKLVD